MTLVQQVVLALAIGCAGYSVGIVHAQQQTHEATDGHPVLVRRVAALEQSHVKVATALELLERRSR